MEPEIRKFRNLKTLETIELEGDFIDALNYISKLWFDGSKVIDFVWDGNSRVTLLSNHPSGNVIGRVYVS